MNKTRTILMKDLNLFEEYQKIENAVLAAVDGQDFREDTEYFNADAHIRIPALLIELSITPSSIEYQAQVRRINPERPNVRHWWEVAVPPWEATTPDQSVAVFMQHIPYICEEVFETAKLAHASMLESYQRGLEAEQRLLQIQGVSA